MGEHRVEPARPSEAAVQASDGVHYAARLASAAHSDAALASGSSLRRP